jgi:hypothetical protein
MSPPAEPDPFALARAAHVAEVRRALRRHGAGCVVSHGSAAVLLGLPLLTLPGRPELTRTGGSRRSGRARVSVARLPDEQIVECDGMTVTAPARTVVDIARRGDFLAGLVVADAALARGLNPEALRQLVVEQYNWPGIAIARDVVRHADGRSESPAETVVRGRCITLELPVPEPQQWFRLPSGRRARVDLDWGPLLVVGEVDGRVKYTDREVLWAEKQRQEGLEESRIVLRWSWRQAMSSDRAFRDRLADAVRRGARLRQLLGLPPAS